MSPVSPLQTSLERLNSSQLQAVQATEGPVLVFAGPGTGKTQILTSRIGYLLEQGVAPNNILALTFTNAGAKAMQERLAQLVGPAAYQVMLTTFHSFCGGVIEQYSQFFPVELRNGGVIAELDQFEMVRQILETGEFPALKPINKPLHHLRSCVHLITQYKREGVSPAEVMKLAQETLEASESDQLKAAPRRKMATLGTRNLDIAQVYAEYETRLRARGQYDYEDMILWVRDALRTNPDIAVEYQERFQYILVDEFQDTNQAQFQVLVALTQYWGDQANVFVVGDPNQSIYRFQGASVSNVLQFWTIFPNCQVITLDQGYRCPPELYTAAATLIAHNSLTDLDPRLKALEQPLQSQRPATVQDKRILYRSHVNSLAEALDLASELRQAHERGVPWSEMAVLSRTRDQLNTAQWVLLRQGIPVVAQQSENSLDQPLVQAVLNILSMVGEVRRGADLERWTNVLMQPWWEFPREEALRLLRAAGRSRDPNHGVWWWLEHEEKWSELDWSDLQPWRVFREYWREWQEEIVQPIPQTIEKILSQAGVYRTLWQDSQWQPQLPFLLSLLQEAQHWSFSHPEARLQEFVERLQAMQLHGMKLAPEYLASQPDAVTLSTAHSAKGREWSEVFLLQVNDGVWSNVSKPTGLAPLPNTIPYAESDEKEELEDDRRLFFVAITRAKEKLWLFTCERDLRQGSMRELRQSQFVLEMGLEATPDMGQTYLPQEVLPQVFTAPDGALLPSLDRGWVLGLVEEFALSYTALESYLNCPAEFFFRYLVRVPQSTTLPLVVGNAVHAGLEFANRSFIEHSKLPVWEAVREKTTRVVSASALTPSNQSLAQSRSDELLKPYLESHHDTWKAPLKVEHKFGAAAPTVFEGLPLVGKVDVIEVIDAITKTVRVVDYKTGRRLTRSELSGKPTDKRRKLDQIYFYALLAELDATFDFRVIEGVFDFLTPSDAGKYIPVSFEVSELELHSLKETLRQVQSELTSLAFLDAPPCGECEVCVALGLQPSISSVLLDDLQEPSAKLE